MPTSSVSVTTPSANAANATGYMQADGFSSPVQPGAPVGTNGVHSNGPARLPFGTLDSVSTGLTAHAGGGQTSALALTSTVNIVTVVGTAADSVKLPATSANTVGRQIWITNTSATSLQAFGAGTDTINGVATATGVAVAAGKTAMLVCNAAGTWVGPIALA